MQNSIVGEEFKEQEFLDYLRIISHDIEDYGPDLIKVNPEMYAKMKIKAKKLKIYASPLGFPIHSYYGVPLKIDYKMKEPYKIIRGGKEINAK